MVNITSSATEIVADAFSLCNTLASVTTATQIGDRAIENCRSLASLTSLASVTIPDSVT